MYKFWDAANIVNAPAIKSAIGFTYGHFKFVAFEKMKKTTCF